MEKTRSFIFGMLTTILVLVVLAFAIFNNRFGLVLRLMDIKSEVPQETVNRLQEMFHESPSSVIPTGEDGQPCVFQAKPGIAGDIDIFDDIPDSLLAKTLKDREINEPQPEEDYFLLLDETPGYGDDEFWFHVRHFKASAPTIMLEEGWVRVTNLQALTPECSLGGLVTQDVPVLPTNPVPTATATVAVPVGTPGPEESPCVYRAQPGIVGDIDIFDEIPQGWLDKTLQDREIDEPQPDIDLFLLLDETPGYGDDEFWLYVRHFKASAPTIMLEEGWVRVTNLQALTLECSLGGLVTQDVPVPTATRVPTATATVAVPVGTPGPEESPCVYRAQPGIAGDIDIFDEIPQGWLDKTLQDREIDEPQPDIDLFLLLDETPGYGDDEFWLYVRHFKASAPTIMLEEGWVRVTKPSGPDPRVQFGWTRDPGCACSHCHPRPHGYRHGGRSRRDTGSRGVALCLSGSAWHRGGHRHFR